MFANFLEVLVQNFSEWEPDQSILLIQSLFTLVVAVAVVIFVIKWSRGAQKLPSEKPQGSFELSIIVRTIFPTRKLSDPSDSEKDSLEVKEEE